MLAIARSISTSMFCFLFAVAAAKAAQDDWFTYRHDPARTGSQPTASDLSDPVKIRGLHKIAQFPPDPPSPGGFKVPGGFVASPIVVDGTAFIGSVDGHFYAFDAANGRPKWQFPKPGEQLSGGGCPHGDQLGGGYGTYGIRTGATFAMIRGQKAVIFGAPDPTLKPFDPTTGKGFGSARLFAFPLSPADPSNPQPIWKSDVVAQVTGCSVCLQNADHSSSECQNAYKEKHERIAFSSPLVLDGKVYVGIHDTGDSPIQKGKVVAVDLDNGHLTRFQFLGAGNAPDDKKLGGSVWNALATDDTGIFFTTGNTHDPWCSFPYTPGTQACPVPVEPEPQPNNGLSLIRVDKDTGDIVWKYQPVPFVMDGDPDWAAGATVMKTSCGELIASVQKDGWSYAIDANQPNQTPSCPLSGHSWQFPATKHGCPFALTDIPLTLHGDDDYRRPGAAWNDVFIVRTGGEDNLDDSPCLGCDPHDQNCVCRGHKELHALNACASEQDRVRWIATIPDVIGAPPGSPQGLPRHISYSSPTVTGGIVFIGTNQDPTDPTKAGHLVVLADPSIVTASQQVCSNVGYSVPACPAPYAPVWSPQVLADIAMPDGGSLASMRNEPVLAEGRVFVATYPRDDPSGPGHVYILAPGPAPDDSVPTIIDSVVTIIE